MEKQSVKSVNDLEVYRLAEKLSDMIWYEFDSWNEKARKTIGFQVIRSSDSIAANIAEGFGRYTGPDKRKFYRYARGSFEETKAWLRKAYRRKIIKQEFITPYSDIINMLGPKLNALINSTK